jgi:hypothetical protein
VGFRAGLDTETTGKIILPLPGIEPRATPAPYSNLYSAESKKARAQDRWDFTYRPQGSTPRFAIM